MKTLNGNKLLILAQIYIDGCVPPALTVQAKEPALDDLLANQLVEPSRDGIDGYDLTGRGVVFMNMLLNTPLPEQHWLDPRTVK